MLGAGHAFAAPAAETALSTYTLVNMDQTTAPTALFYAEFAARGAHLERMFGQNDWGPFGSTEAVFPAALFAQTREPRLAELAKRQLRNWESHFRELIATKTPAPTGEAAFYAFICIDALRRGGGIAPEEEPWIREMLTFAADNQYAWRQDDGLWRGSHHRAQQQGAVRGLAAALYPDDPRAPAWKAYSETGTRSSAGVFCRTLSPGKRSGPWP